LGNALLPTAKMAKPDSSTIDADAAQLAQLGLTQELKRNFSPLSMLGLAFAILNSWTALAASLSLALPSGGPVSVLWGLVGELIFYYLSRLGIGVEVGQIQAMLELQDFVYCICLLLAACWAVASEDGQSKCGGPFE
jgi:hypothetical protein